MGLFSQDFRSQKAQPGTPHQVGQQCLAIFRFPFLCVGGH